MMTQHRNNAHETTSDRTALKRGLTAGGVAATTVAVGVLGHKYGISADILDAQIVPQPPTKPEVVDGMVAVNEGIRSAAPVVALGALGMQAYYMLSGAASRKNRALNTLSKTEYSGMDEVQKNNEHRSALSRAGEKVSRFKRGAGIAALAIVLTSATSGVEHEVSNGPLRPIDAVTNLIGPDNEPYSLILQDDNNTFMDDSAIKREDMHRMAEYASARDVTLIPFNKELLNINGKSALQVSVPDAVFEDMTNVEVDNDCYTVPAIVDETLNVEKGDVVSMNGIFAKVVDVEDDMAQMNRSIAITSDTDMRECLKLGTDESYFGAFAPDASLADVKRILNETGMYDLAAVSEEDFKENNRDFWRANATPILLQLIAYVAIFGGLAAAGERKNALQRNVKEIGILHAAGVDISDIRRIEDRRAFSETLRATILAAPAVPAVAAAFNAAELGMKIGVGPREMAVGSMAVLAAKVAASRSAVHSFEKNLDLSQAVKG